MADQFSYCYITFGIISIIGFLGNIFCLLKLYGKNASAWRNILSGLLVFDIVILVGFIVIAVTFYLFGVDSIDTEAIFTSNLIAMPIIKTGCICSIYGLILLTVERYFLICSPTRPQRRLAKDTALVLLGIIVQFAFLVNLPRWLEYNLEYDSENYILYYHGWIWLWLSFLIPTFVIGVFTFSIWKQVGVNNFNRRRFEGIPLPGNYEPSYFYTFLTIVILMIIFNTISALTVLYCTILRSYKPIIGELYGIYPIVLSSSVKFIIILISLKSRGISKQFYKLGNGVCTCGNAGQLPDPANYKKTVQDTRKVELTSYKYNVRFDDNQSKYTITNSTAGGKLTFLKF